MNFNFIIRSVTCKVYQMHAEKSGKKRTEKGKREEDTGREIDGERGRETHRERDRER